jgi:hypothetical protein
VTVDPSSGTIPTGYLILNVTQGTLKRHAGGYSWETVIGATSGKIGFYGVTPAAQASGASQASVTLGNMDVETRAEEPPRASTRTGARRAEAARSGVTSLLGYAIVSSPARRRLLRGL